MIQEQVGIKEAFSLSQYCGGSVLVMLLSLPEPELELEPESMMGGLPSCILVPVRWFYAAV